MFHETEWRTVARGCGALLVLATLTASAEAVPDLGTGRAVGSLTIYADDTKPRLFYYAPPEIELVEDPDGKPDFHFLETRYTGSATSRDRGVLRHKSLLSFRLRLPRVPAPELAHAASALGTEGRAAEIRPFPIRSLTTALVYTTVGPSDPDTVTLPGGRFEAAPEGQGGRGDGYWTERICTVGLDSLTAQVFRAAIDSSQVILSVGYAFLAEGGRGNRGLEELTGSPALVEELKRALGGSAPSDSATNLSPPLHVIRAGAIAIGIDVKRWPELLRRVDLNDRAPPGYAALDVYCYDFNNALRPDLAEKRVEIDAESIGGRRVKLDTMFRRSEPDIYSAGVRFPVAVRVDRPYRFRVSETKLDGRSSTGRWQEVSSWNHVLDVTSPPPTQGVRSILGP